MHLPSYPSPWRGSRRFVPGGGGGLGGNDQWKNSLLWRQTIEQILISVVSLKKEKSLLKVKLPLERRILVANTEVLDRRSMKKVCEDAGNPDQPVSLYSARLCQNYKDIKSVNNHKFYIILSINKHYVVYIHNKNFIFLLFLQNNNNNNSFNNHI